LSRTGRSWQNGGRGGRAYLLGHHEEEIDDVLRLARKLLPEEWILIEFKFKFEILNSKGAERRELRIQNREMSPRCLCALALQNRTPPPRGRHEGEREGGREGGREGPTWVATPTGQVFRWHFRIMMHPMAMRGPVENPYSSAPRRAATTTSRPEREGKREGGRKGGREGGVPSMWAFGSARKGWSEGGGKGRGQGNEAHRF
jgi:hypothetical protein